MTCFVAALAEEFQVTIRRGLGLEVQRRLADLLPLRHKADSTDSRCGSKLMGIGAAKTTEINWLELASLCHSLTGLAFGREPSKCMALNLWLS